ncbi:MAG: XRE family transcriptional regulator [Acetobacteraceae bacterium]|nr:XRE family transcriptional regulator [Acetobacteraceae bacterium]
MDIRPIRTEADCDWALREIERYFAEEPAPGTPEADRFDVLAALIGQHEAAQWPIEPPDPVEAIRHRMQVAGYAPAMPFGTPMPMATRAALRRLGAMLRVRCCHRNDGMPAPPSGRPRIRGVK